MSSRQVVPLIYTFPPNPNPGDPQTLRELSAQLMARVDPVPYNNLGWLETFNDTYTSVDTSLNGGIANCFGWSSTAGQTPYVTTRNLQPTRIAPYRQYADTLNDVYVYLTDFVACERNSLQQLEVLNHVSADQSLPVGRYGMAVTYWAWQYSNGGSSVAPKRYLRMLQRNDGMGIAKHPRLHGAGTNAPTSAQAANTPRLGSTNTYR